MSVPDPRLIYCKEKNIHHLFELLATKVLHNRPENPFAYLRDELTKVEESESRSKTYDPTVHHQSQYSANASSAKERRAITLAVLGLDNAGKTAIIAALSGSIDAETTPTVGFSPTHCATADHDVSLYDLGGGGNFRGIWHHYFHDCHGVIFVIDAADRSRFDEASQCLRDIVSHEYMAGKPVLIVANKKDISSAVPLSAIEGQILKVGEILKPHKAKGNTVATCAIAEDDGDLDKGINWMISTIDSEYSSLAQRVIVDTARVKEEKRKRLEEMRARIASEN